MTSRPLDLIIARLEHAYGQLQGLDDEMDSFNRARPYRAWIEREPQSGDYLVLVEPTREIPARWGFLTGDFINNVRSSLDNVVCAMQGANVERAAFPILKDDPAPKTFNKAAPRLQGIAQSAIDIIETLQPYRSTKHASTVAVPIGQLLYRLDRLWNNDKHRIPTYAMSTLQCNYARVNPREFTVVESNLGHFDSRHVMLRLHPVSPNHLKPYIDGEIVAQIAFQESTGLAGTVPIDMNDLYQCVRYDVVPLLAPFI